MSSPPSPSSAIIRITDPDNPYNLQHFHDDYHLSLSDVRLISTSVTGDQTHAAPSSATIRITDPDNPYNLQHFHDDYHLSLSDVRPISTSVTGDQTHAAAAAQLPSFQDLTRQQENSHKHIDATTDPYNPYGYGQPVSIGSMENNRSISQPNAADGVYYEGYGLPPSKTDIRPVGSSVTGTTTAGDQNAAPRPFDQMSVNSTSIKNVVPPDYYNQQEYK